MSWISRVRGLFGRRMDDDLEAELQSHLEMRTQRNLEIGMSADEARRNAVRRFGNIARVKEDTRRVDIVHWIDTFAQDLRYGIRSMRKTPAFAVTAIVVLALGIAANTIVFSLLQGAVFNPLPYPEPHQLSLITGNDGSSISYPNFRDLQAGAKSFESMALYRFDSASFRVSEHAIRVNTCMATNQLFDVFRVRPLFGRFFSAEDDQVGSAPVLVLSENAWRRDFGASPDIVGRSIAVSGRSYTVIGVAPAYFRFFRVSAFLPLGQWNDQRFQSRSGTFGTRVLARQLAGVPKAQADAELQHIAANLAAQYPDVDKGMRFVEKPLAEVMVARLKPMTTLFSVAVGLVLLIACVNLGTLLVARSAFRQREFAVRAALGASRLRIARQLLTESAALSLAGGALGVLLARWGLKSALSLLPFGLPADASVQIDFRVVAFAAGLSLLCTVVFGSLPVVTVSHTRLEPALRSGGRGSTHRGDRLQRIMVCTEVAIAVVLLAATGLLLRSVQRLLQVELGFDPKHVVMFQLGLPAPTLSDPARVRLTLERRIEDLEALPGVEAAAANLGNLPLTGESDVAFYRTDRPRPATQNDMTGAMWYAVTPGYFRTMSIGLTRGRDFRATDTADSAPVAVISESVARKTFPGEDPIGKLLHLEFFDQTVQIVGVVQDIKQFGPATSDTPGVYLPLWQVPDRMLPLLGRFTGVVVRTRNAPQVQATAIRRTLESSDPESAVYSLAPMQELVTDGMSMQRASAVVLAAFGMFALLLATTGIYGVIAYLVGQRTQEIGVRLTLGATPAAIRTMVLRGGLAMVVTGLVVGVVATPLWLPLVRSMLFGVRPADWMTGAIVAVTLFTAGSLASYIPARRAARIDPMTALRHE